MSRRVDLGVVGLGHIGRFHAANLSGRVPGARLAAVADLNPDLARSAGESFGVPWSTSVDEVVENTEGVVVATPPAAHADVIVEVAAAGKHVFVEKPIALDWDGAYASVAAADAADVLLQVGFHRRFDADFCVLASRIAKGNLGPPRMLRVAHRDMLAPTPSVDITEHGHLIVDALVHDFDTARWLVGEIETVFAQVASFVDPEIATGDAGHVVAALRFQNGALGMLDASRCVGYGYECSAELIGADATGRIFQPQGGNLAWLSDGVASTRFPSDYQERHAAAYVAELEAFAGAIRDGAGTPVSGDCGLRALAASFAALRSVRESSPVSVADELRAGELVRQRRSS